jgi:hypothetical protein
MRREHSAPSFERHSHTPSHQLHKRHSASDLSSKGEHRSSTKSAVVSDQSDMVPVIQLHIFAISRKQGEAMRSKLSGLIREKFLHEHTMERREEIPKHNERKMYEIGQECDVFVSIDKGNNF